MNFRIVIPSARASNLMPCLDSILACDPELSASAIIVVDDGARAGNDALFPPITWVPGIQPFVFARNVNLGIRAAGTADVIVLNDDARLLMQCGFTCWAEQMRRRPTIGICSAGIHGSVCNPRQRVDGRLLFRHEPDRLAFVCVYIPRAVIDAVGLLDERFIGYGFEDFDYCRRVRDAGFRLAIWDGCVVQHADELSTYRRLRPDLQHLFEDNRDRYREKWTSP